MSDGARPHSDEDAFAVQRGRYYFDERDGSDVVRDDQGLELDGIEAAKREALLALPDIARDQLPTGDRREFVIEVRDESGRTVLTARLSLTVQTALERT